MSGLSRILITGATGSTGRHLSELVLRTGAEVFGFARRDRFMEGVSGRCGDITRPAEIGAWLEECRPDRIFHLAAAVHGNGSPDPQEMWRVNVEGTLHLLESVRNVVPSARVLVAGSSGIYGQPAEASRPIGEETEPQPRSAYALSKAAQDLVALQFFQEYGLSVVRTRTFNQTGPGELEGLVCAAVARQLARIEAGLQEPRLRVVTLRTRRDFCDVRDVAAGCWAALEHGEAGGAYNICSGQSHSIREMVDILVTHAGMPDLEIEETDSDGGAQGISSHVGDASRLRACSGWEPRIPLTQSLRELLEEWREKVRREK